MKLFFTRRNIATFSVIAGLLSLLLFTSLYFFKKNLQSYCRVDLEKKLHAFVQSRSLGFVIKEPKSSRGLDAYGLDFVRLSSSEQQLFHSLKPESSLGFTDLSKLDTSGKGVWISLHDPIEKGSWTVDATVLENGTIIQVGKEYLEINDLYTGVKNGAWIVFAFILFLSGAVTFFSYRRSRSSLEEVRKTLDRAVHNTTLQQLDSSGNEELDPLYRSLNAILSQNAQLIKEMQESLDNVAHDLRTPMTRLRSVAEYGLQKEDNESLQEALADCLEESERVLSMLGIMMSVAEAESGTMQLKKEEFDLQSMVADVVTLYEYVAEEKKVSLKTEIEPGILISGDKTRLTQVCANIVDNGIKYSSERGTVSIATERKGNEGVALHFEDDGIGIAPHEINRIWERLFRGDRSRTEQGLGLGLNYVRAVVEAHGGEVKVSSQLDRGTRISVELNIIHTHKPGK